MCVCVESILLESLLDLGDACVLLHHQEVRFPVLVQFSDPAEQEARARVLVSDHGDQFPAAGHHGDAGEIPGEKHSASRDTSCEGSADLHFRFNMAPPIEIKKYERSLVYLCVLFYFIFIFTTMRSYLDNNVLGINPNIPKMSQTFILIHLIIGTSTDRQSRTVRECLSLLSDSTWRPQQSREALR